MKYICRFWKNLHFTFPRSGKAKLCLYIARKYVCRFWKNLHFTFPRSIRLLRISNTSWVVALLWEIL